MVLAFYPLNISMPVSASASTTVYGDADNNGTVNIGDVIYLLRYLHGNVLTSNINMKYSDVDKNTVIDTNDTKILLKYLAGLVSTLPYSESGSTFNYTNYTVPSDEARYYTKYNCSTGSTSSYLLDLPASLTSSSNQLRSGSIDDRILDSGANAQCIVYLSYKKSNGNYYRGSGFIVDDHIIATCAHCLYDGTAFNTDFKVKVYNEAGTSNIATYSASELHIPSNYYSNQAANYDYGLIYVDEDLSDYGTMALSLPTDNYKYTGQTVYASGFPAEVNGNYTTSRYYGAGVVTTTTNSYKIYYTCYISGGDSGGPVFIDYTLGSDHFRSAVGINTNSTGTIHYGNRITLPLLRFYYNNANIGL